MKQDNIDVQNYKEEGAKFCEDIIKKIPDVKKTRDLVKVTTDIAVAISKANKEST